MFSSEDQTNLQFMRLWASFKNDVTKRIDDDYSNEIEDIEESDELFKVICPKNKVMVQNRMTPRKEIWLSSPISGPHHFQYDTNCEKWYNPSQEELYEMLFSDQKTIQNK